MRKMKIKLLGLSSASTLFLMGAQNVYAQTQAWTGVCISTTDPDVATLQGFQCFVANILSVFITMIGVVGLFVLIKTSFQWMVAGGNSQAMEQSKKAITFAILGIILALSSFMILNLISNFTGVESILEFVIPNSNTQWE